MRAPTTPTNSSRAPLRCCALTAITLAAMTLGAAGCQRDDPSPSQTFTSAPASPDDTTVRPQGIVLHQGDDAQPPQALKPPTTPQPAPGEMTQGSCEVDLVDLRMSWKDCAPGVNCTVSHENGRPEVTLHTPASGPVVLEAHLMTDLDDLNGYWPSSIRHGIPAHYKLSEEATGYQMKRRQPWAPAGEGGCQFGQGSAVNAVPVLAEAWYITMFWRKRPAPGTRMIVRNPLNGRAVVAAAGYETGPGSNTAIAGVSEETHHHLGTGHRETLEVGFARDQTLPFGPIRCKP